MIYLLYYYCNTVPYEFSQLINFVRCVDSSNFWDSVETKLEQCWDSVGIRDGKMNKFFGPARPVVPFPGPARPGPARKTIFNFRPVWARLGPFGPVWGPAKIFSVKFYVLN